MNIVVNFHMYITRYSVKVPNTYDLDGHAVGRYPVGRVILAGSKPLQREKEKHSNTGIYSLV